MEHEQHDELDVGEFTSLPNFIPPEAKIAPPAPDSTHSDNVAVEVPVVAGAEISVALIEGALVAVEGVEVVQGEQPASVGDDIVQPVIDGTTVEATSEPVVVADEVQEEADRIKELENDLAAKDDPEGDKSKEDELAAKADASELGVDGAVQSEDGKTVTMDASAYAALMSIANRVNAGGALVDPDELQRVNASLNQGPGQGSVMHVAGAGATRGEEQIKTGAQALAEGGMSLVGGAASLTGAVFKGAGKVASALAGAIRGSDSGNQAQVAPSEAIEPASGGVTVLPRLSDYRVEQVEKAASTYEDAHKAFWESGAMPDVRKEIEERARVTGISVEDVMEKMKPNGEMAELGESFNAAVAASPDAQSHKKVMDKALEGWGRQHGRAQDELLNPEQEGTSHHDSLKDRLDKAQGKMKQHTSDLPLFDGEDKSHAEKLREMIAKIVEKITEFAKGVVNAVRGKKTADAEVESAPAP